MTIPRPKLHTNETTASLIIQSNMPAGVCLKSIAREMILLLQTKTIWVLTTNINTHKLFAKVGQTQHVVLRLGIPCFRLYYNAHITQRRMSRL